MNENNGRIMGKDNDQPKRRSMSTKDYKRGLIDRVESQGESISDSPETTGGWADVRLMKSVYGVKEPAPEDTKPQWMG